MVSVIWPGKNAVCGLEPPTIQDFLIHGLWPKNNDNMTVNADRAAEFYASLPDKAKDWINENFIPINGSQQNAVIHEFVNHGIHFTHKAPKDKKEKFINYIHYTKSKSGEWRDFVHATFQEAGLVPNNNKYDIKVLQKSLERTGKSIMINCSLRKVQDKHTVEMVDEVRICLDSDLRIVPCNGAKSLITNCHHYVFFYPIRRRRALVVL